jgi:predicted phage tail protein
LTWANVASGSHTVTARAYDDRNLTSTSAAITLTVSSPPAVTVDSPANGAVYQAGQTVTIAATATDPDGVRKVEFYRGATLIATATVAPYTATSAGLAAGSYQFTVRAYDSFNAFRDSSPVNVIVNAPPAVSITAPANNAVVAAPASVTLTSNATDTDGTISQVQFYNGATLIGTASTAPFNLALTNLGPGPYRFTARAYDNNGGITTSAAVNMTVSGGAAPTPVVYQYDELGRLIGVTH